MSCNHFVPTMPLPNESATFPNKGMTNPNESAPFPNNYTCWIVGFTWIRSIQFMKANPLRGLVIFESKAENIYG